MHEKNNDLDVNFSHTRIVTLTLEIWPWAKVKVMEYPWVIDYDCLNGDDCVIQIQLTSEKQCVKHDFWLYVHVTLTSIFDHVSRSWHPYVMDNNGYII